MTITFLVAITLEDSDVSNLAAISDDITEDLSQNFVVESVHPWARPLNPTASPAGGFASLPLPFTSSQAGSPDAQPSA